jgi:hypothetical protein
MRTMDRVAAWLLIAFGATHLVLTHKADPQLGMNAIWFASGGLLMMTIAALNLLRVAYGPIARGVRAVSVIANVALLLLISAISARVPMRGNPQVVIGMVLAAVLTAFSIFRRVPQAQARMAHGGE